MKKIIFLGCFLFLLLAAAQASIRTVSDDPNHPAQYTNLQAAHDASINDDTILWYGNGASWGLNMNKRLTLMGVGQLIANYGPSITVNAPASGSRFLSGFYSQFTCNVLDTSFSIEVSNCHIDRLSGYPKGTFTNCIIRWLQNLVNISTVTSTDFIFYNCLFGWGETIRLDIDNGSINLSFLFNHCVFFGALDFYEPNNSLTNVFFSDCIFTQAFANTSCLPLNTVFDRCLFRGFSIDNTQFCGLLVGSNSIINAPNPFVAEPNQLNQGDYISNLITADFRLNAASLGNDAASDGTDIGLHGGSNAWPVSYHYGLNPPGVPVVNSLSLDNYVIGVSDQLQMNAQGSIPSNQ